MNISFQKIDGEPGLGFSFFWKLAIQTKSMAIVKDEFIPELFFDYLFVKEGRVKCIDQAQGTKIRLPQQTLKTIHTTPAAWKKQMRIVLH